MTDQELIERWRKLIERESSIFVAKVISVEGLTCKVLPVNSDLEITGIELSLVENPDIVIVPEVNSYVLVANMRINRMQKRHFILYATRAASIKWNGDNYGGMVKAIELKTQLDKNNEILTAILNVINGSEVAEPGSGSPSALQAALKLALTGKGIGNFNSIQNQTIKHGG